MSKTSLEKILVKYHRQLRETKRNLRTYTIKLAFQKNAISAINMTARQLKAKRASTATRRSSRLSRLQAQEELRNDDGPVSLEDISAKVATVVIELKKSSEKLER